MICSGGTCSCCCSGARSPTTSLTCDYEVSWSQQSQLYQKLATIFHIWHIPNKRRETVQIIQNYFIVLGKEINLVKILQISSISSSVHETGSRISASRDLNIIQPAEMKYLRRVKGFSRLYCIKNDVGKKLRKKKRQMNADKTG